MYRRFLNNNDYLDVITPGALAQLTRSNADRFSQAKGLAEVSIREYLSKNYEIERELNAGKYIAPHDCRIIYPVGAFIYLEEGLYEVIRAISVFKAPMLAPYWEENTTRSPEDDGIANYSQFGTYRLGDEVTCNNAIDTCLQKNGLQFGDIRIPLVNG